MDDEPFFAEFLDDIPWEDAYRDQYPLSSSMIGTTAVDGDLPQNPTQEIEEFFPVGSSLNYDKGVFEEDQPQSANEQETGHVVDLTEDSYRDQFTLSSSIIGTAAVDGDDHENPTQEIEEFGMGGSSLKYGKGVFKEDQSQDSIFPSASEQETGPIVDLTEDLNRDRFPVPSSIIRTAAVDGDNHENPTQEIENFGLVGSSLKYGKGVFKEDQSQDSIFPSTNEQETGPIVDLTEDSYRDQFTVSSPIIRTAAVDVDDQQNITQEIEVFYPVAPETQPPEFPHDTTTAPVVKTGDTPVVHTKYGKGVFKDNEQETGPIVDLTEAQAAAPIAAHDLTEAQAAVPIGAHVFLPFQQMINGLRSAQITEVRGEVHYVDCAKGFIMTFSFQQKFQEMLSFLDRNREVVGPEMFGNLKANNLTCTECRRQWTIPVLPDKKDTNYEHVNWLFLFLGKQLQNTFVKQMKLLLKQIKPRYEPSREKKKLMFVLYERIHELLQA